MVSGLVELCPTPGRAAESTASSTGRRSRPTPCSSTAARGRDGRRRRGTATSSTSAPPAAAALLDHAGHPLAGAAVRAAPPPQGRRRADRSADGEVLEPLDEDEVRCGRAQLGTRASRRSPSASSSRISTRSTSGAPRRSSREEMPGAFVTSSADIFPQFREFERFTTACMNAFVGPTTGRYLERLGSALDRGRAGELHVMMSNGGVAAVETAAQKPVTLLLSGPRGGRARRALGGRDDGPQAADHLRRRRYVRRHRDRHGGRDQRGLGARHVGRRVSVARADDRHPHDRRRRRLDRVRRRGRRVPRRAAERRREPGPGLLRPGRRRSRRFTDANVVLGRIDPERFLGGEMRSTATPRSPPCSGSPSEGGLPLLEAAEGIVTIANANMSRAIRSRTSRRATIRASSHSSPSAAAARCRRPRSPSRSASPR